MTPTLKLWLTTLCDGRPGVRTRLQITALEPITNRACGGEPSSPAENPCLDFIASNATLDRFHEIIEPSGWRLENYRRNPVFQNAHNYHDVIFTLGRALTTEVRHANPCAPEPHLYQRIQFATDANPIARIAYGLYKGRFLNAVSVGFIPIRWEDAESTTGTGATPRTATVYRRRYLEQELLEVSAVAIPANPDALALGYRSGAIAKSDLKSSLELLREALNPADPAKRVRRPADRIQLFALAQELHRVLRRA